MSDAVLRGQEETLKKINAALGELEIPHGQSEADPAIPWVVFTLENRRYAINAGYVLRAIILYEIIPYMDAPIYCPGVMWDRDGIIRLLDLRALFGQGDYLSVITNEMLGLPMIVIVGLDGTRRGMIVDEILMVGNFDVVTEALTDDDHAPSRYIKAKLRFDCLEDPALILSPDSFSAVEFEHQNVKLDWKGYVDMRLKAEKLRE